MYVRPKKALGQHFLADTSLARKIVDALNGCSLPVLEVGPGTGILTRFLLERPETEFRAVEIDSESIRYLLTHFPSIEGRLLQADFLKIDLSALFTSPFVVMGNFPYHISSQIFFKILNHRNQIPMVVGMLQKEVAERIASPSGSKAYGILSVLLQAWYHIEYLFTVSEHVFVPPPKVKSAVVRLTRNSRTALPCNEALFTQVVKATFNQRRKMIRNSLMQLTRSNSLPKHPLLALRPEQLEIEQFVELTNVVSNLMRALE